MRPVLVYAVCDSESVAETLTILLESDHEVRCLQPEEMLRGAARPALLIDACRGRDRGADPRAPWPGVPTLRLNPDDAFDPSALRSRIAASLHSAPPAVDVDTEIVTHGCRLAGEIQPRLVATRCLLRLARDESMWAQPAWRALLREQLIALAENCGRLVDEACRD